MSSPATNLPPPATRSNDEVLVRVEGVSKKFCRSLKKSLWYGVCDIAGELLPFGKRQRVAGNELLVASEEGRVASSELLVASQNTSAEGGTGAQGLRGGRVPQAGPQGFAGRENSEPNRAGGASEPATSYPQQRRQAHPPPVTRHSPPPRRTSTHGMMIYGKENFTQLRM